MVRDEFLRSDKALYGHKSLENTGVSDEETNYSGGTSEFTMPPIVIDSTTPIARERTPPSQSAPIPIPIPREEQIQKAPKKVEKKVADDLPPIPPELDTDEFRAAWAERIEERREARKPIKPTQAKRQFKILVEVADLRGSDFAAQLVRAASANETLGVVWADQLARWRHQGPQHQILGGGLPLIDGDLS
jgi:hypothetical protein